jgi:hypothetical protein
MPPGEVTVTVIARSGPMSVIDSLAVDVPMRGK